jgi:hypothetical protein
MHSVQDSTAFLDLFNPSGRVICRPKPHQNPTTCFKKIQNRTKVAGLLTLGLGLGCVTTSETPKTQGTFQSADRRCSCCYCAWHLMVPWWGWIEQKWGFNGTIIFPLK